MQSSVKTFRKIVVALVGFPLLVIGAILVPLPGPGFLVMLIALVLLSTEFDWAKKHADTVRAKLKAIYDKSMARADAIEKHGKKPKDPNSF